MLFGGLFDDPLEAWPSAVWVYGLTINGETLTALAISDEGITVGLTIDDETIC